MNRLQSFIDLKEAAYSLADGRGFLKKHILRYDPFLNMKERYITESIIRETWDYDKTNSVEISDGQETRLIMQNCVYAGMYASKYDNISSEGILTVFRRNNITKIENFVEQDLKFTSKECFVSSLVAKGLVQDVYNDNIHLYPNYSTAEGRWEYYKDIACVMFELGAMYYNNRDN